MYGHFLLLVCAAIASATFQINEFAERTCDLLDIWNRSTNTRSAIQYTQDNEGYSILLSNDCHGKLSAILGKCSDSPGLQCNNIHLSIAEESLAYGNITRKALERRLQSDQQQSESCPYFTSDSPITTSSEVDIIPSLTLGISDLTEALTSTVIGKIYPGPSDKSRTVYTRAKISTGYLGLESSHSQTRGSMEALPTSIGRICLIKESEYHAADKGGRCRCSDGDTIEFAVGVCEIEF